MTLSNEQRLGEIVALRTKLRTKPELRSELNSAVSEVLDRNGIKLEPGLSLDLIFALPEEITDALSEVILPGGTNC